MNVRRLVLFVLVFVLSGAPASAVVCDLVLCMDASSGPPQEPTSCHEHAAAPENEPALSGVGNCSHLFFVAPFLTAGHRDAAYDVMLPVVVDAARPGAGRDQAFAADLSKYTATPSAVVFPFQPLRI